MASLVVAGCGTASTSEYSSQYTGTDESLQSSPTDRALALRRKLARERGDRPVAMPSAAEHAMMLEDYGIWRRQLLVTIDEARAACARKTGDSGKRHFWTGYDPAFLACMSERGWVRRSAAIRFDRSAEGRGTPCRSGHGARRAMGAQVLGPRR